MGGRKEAQGQRGFTLVELLLAVSIGAIITGVAVMAIWQFANLTRRHEQALTVSGQLQQAATVLNRDVVSAASGQVSEDASGEQMVLQVPRIPDGSFGTLADPMTSTITYTYSIANETLSRESHDDEEGETNSRVVASYVDDVDFGPAGAVSTTVRITLSVTRGDSSGQTVLDLHRRAGGE